MLPVPYRGTVPAFTDVVAGRPDAMLDTPTMTETVPGIVRMSWLGLAAPPQTPRPIIDRLNSELRRALELPDIKQWLTETGVLAAPSTPEEFQKRIETEIELYTKIAEANG